MTTTAEPAPPAPRWGRRVVVVGGGPGGYEAALVAARGGADVTLVEEKGVGGAAVLTDAVPSKTLIATAEWMTIASRAPDLGIRAEVREVDIGRVNSRVLELAAAQSRDIADRLAAEGVDVVSGSGRLVAPGRVAIGAQERAADVVLIATGATPRVLPDAVPDGERILDWTHLYRLESAPERLLVVGSGVTGVEFAGAYNALGCEVVLVSSRDRILPGEDPDAAQVIEDVFRARGMTVLARRRAAAVRRAGAGVSVELTDGEVLTGSHCLLAVGATPRTEHLAAAGVTLDRGYVVVDRVSRTNLPGVYAAGDCTGVLPLASVAAMQGRIAMAHALGDVVLPLDLGTVAANVFTAPEIASVGSSARELEASGTRYLVSRLDLLRNPRAKMLGLRDGFVKLFAHPATGTVLGGVVVAPRAGELIFPVTLAVSQRLTVDDVAQAFTVYPSLSGSIAEAARLLRERPDAS